MNFVLNLTLFIVIVSVCNGKTVLKTRFNGRYPTHPTCRAGFYENAQSNGNNVEYIGRIAALRMNCSNIPVSTFVIGEADKHGNYSELLGLLQHDEVDYVMALLRLELLEHEVVAIGPVDGPADVIILSRVLEATNASIFVTDVVYHFDELIYYYLTISVVMVVCFLAIFSTDIQPLFQSIHGYLIKLVHGSIELVFKVVELVVDQENYSATNWPLKWVWIMFGWAIFLTVHTYLLNLMSSDKVAFVKPAQIDSIDDQLSDYWSDVKPIFFKNNYLFPLLNKSKPGTVLHKTYNLLMKSPNESIATVKITENQASSDLYERVINGIFSNKNSLLLPEVFYRLTRPMGCLAEPNNSRLIHPSAETFASGNLHQFYNKKMNKIQQNYLSYRYQTNAEMGMWTGYSKIELTAKVTEYGIAQGVEYVKCIDSYVEEPPEEPFSLQLPPLSTGFQLAAHGILVSLLCLFCELICLNLPRTWLLLVCFRKPIRRKRIAPLHRRLKRKLIIIGSFLTVIRSKRSWTEVRPIRGLKPNNW